MLIAAIAAINQKDEFPEKHLEVVLRNIGHQLLLSVRDSSSRVLPVKQLNENTYLLSFQNDFGFSSDTLINLVQRTFQKSALADNYIVSLKDCRSKETVFAFEMNSRAGDLTPCRGRKLEVGSYAIEIEFLKKTTFNYSFLWLLMIPLGVAGFYAKNKYWKGEEQVSVPDNDNYLQLGSYKFYVDNNVLKTGDKSVTLSENETKALEIFAAHINQVVEREKLMKALWEDKGLVVISRNVDVLVSKLRKKLTDDPSVKFINVPGRGYKFIIE